MNNKLDIRKAWPKFPQNLCVAVICLLTATGISFAEKSSHLTELNKLLLSAAGKDPDLFGSDALCERDQEFWDAVEKSSLLAVLERQEGFREITLDADHTVWFVPVSACFSGNRAAFIMLIRNGDEFRSIDTPITGIIENIRLEDGKILFNVTSYGGFSKEYRYVYSYDGQQLSEKLLEQHRSD